jgi:hypothetical protein
MDSDDHQVTGPKRDVPFARFEERMDRRLDLMEQRFKDYWSESLRGLEARLLQAFSEYSEINNRRAEQLRLAMLASRVSTLEQRIFRVEERLDNPPKA